jgi:hypothetical protein
LSKVFSLKHYYFYNKNLKVWLGKILEVCKLKHCSINLFAVNRKTVDLCKKTALKFVILLGIVSFFADMTYEDVWSITGQYLALLGASEAVVGTVAGLGELIGYGFRLISRYASDKSGKYWLFTFLGFAWFLGSALMGCLYDVSLPALVLFSLGIQLASLPLFYAVK